MEVADQNHSSEGILQNAVLKNFPKFMENACAEVSFSMKLQAIRREHLFMEYIRATASSRYPPEKLLKKFLKIPKKTPLKQSFFNNVADSIP